MAQPFDLRQMGPTGEILRLPSRSAPSPIAIRSSPFRGRELWHIAPVTARPPNSSRTIARATRPGISSPASTSMTLLSRQTLPASSTRASPGHPCARFGFTTSRVASNRASRFCRKAPDPACGPPTDGPIAFASEHETRNLPDGRGQHRRTEAGFRRGLGCCARKLVFRRPLSRVYQVPPRLGCRRPPALRIRKRSQSDSHRADSEAARCTAGCLRTRSGSRTTQTNRARPRSSSALSRPVETARGKWQVSIAGGSQPRWRGDGKELFYIDPDHRLMAVDIQLKLVSVRCAPRSVYHACDLQDTLQYQYDVTRDGKRRPSRGGVGSGPVVQNWRGGLRK